MALLLLAVNISPSAAARVENSVRAAGVNPTPGGRISAVISDKTFALAQAPNVDVSFKFSRTSKRFAYLLERRRGSSWMTVRSVTKKGRFKGNHSLSLTKVFGGTPIALGNYRLRLFADKNRVLLRFAVTAVQPITGATAINAGGRLTCASFSGRVSCWGFNQDGDGTARLREA